ncbi:hypothetical protein HanIR_Chr09g0440421 [Helianthus annuus]|nr:hypothetical protein HanIR_Chr09g0440421 [Helianthus annuus]
MESKKVSRKLGATTRVAKPNVVSRWIPPNKGPYTNSVHVSYPPTRYNSAPPVLDGLPKDEKKSVDGTANKTESKTRKQTGQVVDSSALTLPPSTVKSAGSFVGNLEEKSPKVTLTTSSTTITFSFN